MARTLKTYQTSAGFFDLAVAAPSMKAALEAWGSRANLFHQGFARETNDAAVVAATTARPGVVLRRPVGSKGPFREDSALPKDLPVARPVARPTATKRSKAPPPPEIDEVEARAAQISFERERQRREKARLKEEQEQERTLAKRERTIARAQAALDKARAEHERRRSALDDERAAIERRERAEDARWAKQRATLETALRLAHRT